MSTQKKIDTVAAVVIESLILAASHLAQSPTGYTASPYRMSIMHFENGKPVGTHLVPDAWYAFAIRMGYCGERLDELWHYCQDESHQFAPCCRRML